MGRKRMEFSPRMEDAWRIVWAGMATAPGAQGHQKVLAAAIEHFDAVIDNVDRESVLKALNDYNNDISDASLILRQHQFTVMPETDAAIKRLDEKLRAMQIRIPRSKSGVNTRLIVALALAFRKR